MKNALKFTKSGMITVETMFMVNEERLKVAVKDTGVGIAPEDINLLFTRFGKLQRTATMNSEGIGLGLTIVKTIVESLNGEITVNSRGVDQGSTFSFTMDMQLASCGEETMQAFNVA